MSFGSLSGSSPEEALLSLNEVVCVQLKWAPKAWSLEGLGRFVVHVVSLELIIAQYLEILCKAWFETFGKWNVK